MGMMYVPSEVCEFFYMFYSFCLKKHSTFYLVKKRVQNFLTP